MTVEVTVHPQALTCSLSFFKRLLQELVESSRYDTRSDFTVVIQPFFREIIVPRLPVSNEALSFTFGTYSHVCLPLNQQYRHFSCPAGETKKVQPISLNNFQWSSTSWEVCLSHQVGTTSWTMKHIRLSSVFQCLFTLANIITKYTLLLPATKISAAVLLYIIHWGLYRPLRFSFMVS